MATKPVIGISTGLELQEGDPNHWHQTLDLDYVRLIEENGMIPFLLPFTQKEDVEEEIMDRLDGLLVSGGEDIHPRFYGEVLKESLELVPDLRVKDDLKLVHRALAGNKPLLAICYGLQLLNVAQGGTIYQDISPGKDVLSHRKGNHSVYLREGTKLHHLFQVDSIEVNSFHHQSVKELGEGLQVSAVAPDGGVEAIEHEERKFVLGLQWHPEKKADHLSRKIMKAFRKACSG
ncbi:MAG: gamma-glutamyl-gamma-aminobutyrate hydrolase family protein [Nitrospirae bacterium]|nr:gamma-glutamyl-gamma-aminobutyrate hydrolase family protein [Nitrospirota bacterium]